jgi:hypothetical protein
MVAKDLILCGVAYLFAGLLISSPVMLLLAVCGVLSAKSFAVAVAATVAVLMITTVVYAARER